MSVSTPDMDRIEAEMESAVAQAQSIADLEIVRVSELGKKGRLSQQLRALSSLPEDERRGIGRRLNALKATLLDAISTRRKLLERAILDAELAQQSEDLSLPPRPATIGCLHPVMQTIDQILTIFAHMGFAVAEGPDIEDDFHNFGALNFAENHPARSAQDTFFLARSSGNSDDPHLLLRTHTSPVQIRTMKSKPPPLRIVVPGRVYRRDWDATHTPMFHQIEGLVIDQSTHMGDLKSCLDAFLEAFFGRPAQTRFRPHFFPFTEPSAEMDVRYRRADGRLDIGTGDQWMEILGCGMVHPRVLEACDIDPERYQGYAFGLGVDRLTMLKYGMTDLRAFFDADAGWSREYGFKPFAAYM